MLKNKEIINKLVDYIEDIMEMKIDIVSDDSLFSIGFDSMRIMALVNRLRRERYQISFADLIVKPTLEEWARLLSQQEVKWASCSEKISSENIESLPEDFPLAPMQHAYWVGSMDGQRLGNVSAHLYVEFDGKNIDLVLLQKALNQLIQRHEMLRVKVLGNGYQKINDQLESVDLNILDLTCLSKEEIEERLIDIRETKSNQKIFQDKKSVFEVSLTLLPDQKNRLHVDIDMIAADAVSYRILMNELAEIYSGFDQLPEIHYSYKEYILKKYSREDEQREKDKKWWQEKILSFPDGPSLPANINRNIQSSSSATRLFYWISPEQRKSIELFAREFKVTVAMVLATIFSESIGVFTKEKEFFLNLPLFDREPFHQDINYLVGDFSSSILLNINLNDKVSIIERIRQISQVFTENVVHSSYGALDVLRDLGRLRETSVLAPVVYTSAVGLGELFSKKVIDSFGSPSWIISQGPQVILDAQVTELNGGFLANWDTRKDAFMPGVIEVMFDTYVQNLKEIALSKSYWKSRFTSLPIQFQIKEREKYNNIPFDISGKLLHQNFFENAVNYPEKIALYWVENGNSKKMNYKELSEKVLTVSSYLISKGVSVGDTLALSLPKGINQIIFILGIFSVGAAYVPISIHWPELRKKNALRTAEVSFYLVDKDFLEENSIEIQLIHIDEALAHQGRLSKPIYPSVESTAYIIFTSGSTGEPKGVEVTHKAVMNTLEVVNHLFDVKFDDISLGFSSLEFDLSIQDIFGMLNVGGSIFVLNEKDRQDQDIIIDYINQFSITQLYAVPSLLEMILSSTKNLNLPSLKVVILGGDKISPQLFYQFKKNNPDCRFAGLGGATETAIHCTYFEVKNELDSSWGCVPYGYPLYNMSCKVVDEFGVDCANSVVGELLVSGQSLAKGYVNMPDKTAERFIEIEGKTWYRTSDLVRYNDSGMIEYIGRSDNQVKIRGYRIEIDEIEGALNLLNEIKNSIVLVVSNQGKRLFAFVQMSEEKIIFEEEKIKNHLGKILPIYMIPDHIIKLNSFPLTHNKKIDRNYLISIAEEYRDNRGETEPNTCLEKLVAEEFARFSGANKIYLEDDFFSLGGDSVLATKLISSLRQSLDFNKIAISDLFEYRTLASFISRLKEIEDQKGLLEKTAEIMLELNMMIDDLH